MAESYQITVILHPSHATIMSLSSFKRPYTKLAADTAHEDQHEDTEAPLLTQNDDHKPDNFLLSDNSDSEDNDVFAEPEPYLEHTAVEGSSSNLINTEVLSSHDLNSSTACNQNSDLEQQNARGGLLASQRAMNVVRFLFPFRQTYERLSNGLSTGRLQANSPGRFVGQGTDGVFRNLMAKPDSESSRVTEETHPPTYEEAAVDAAPEYWESTIISPMYEDEVFVQGLPVGNVANFIWNLLVTVAFQLVGFVLCYLLHTSHAAKHGTRSGLGITFILFGHGQLPTNSGRSDKIPVRYQPDNADLRDVTISLSIKNGKIDSYTLGFQHESDSMVAGAIYKAPYLAYALIAFGIFIFIKAIIDFWCMKQIEKKILAPPLAQPSQSTTEAVDDPQGEWTNPE